MAAFSSLPSAIAGGINPFQAIWAPLVGAAINSTRGRPTTALPPLPLPPPPDPAPAPTQVAAPPVAAAQSSPPASPPVPTVPATDPAEAPSPPAGPDTGAPGATPLAPEAESQRRRGRPSLITTSLRGVLSPRPVGLSRKTLLGE